MACNFLSECEAEWAHHLVVLLGGVIVSKLCRELFADNGIWSIGGMGSGPTSL